MRIQKKDGEVVNVNQQRAKALLADGGTVVNPQSTFERQDPKARAKKSAKKKAAPKKVARKKSISD